MLGVVRDVQHRVAAEAGVAFWDWKGRMGGDCSAFRLTQGDAPLMRGDHVHFTGPGGDWIGVAALRRPHGRPRPGPLVDAVPDARLRRLLPVRLFHRLVAGSRERRRKLFLLLASWFFYAQWDWRFVGLLIGSAILNWGVAALIARRPEDRRGWLVGLGVAANLLILGFFKYYGFFVEQAGDLLTRFGWERDLPLLQIVLPVGISFFTFQGISYVVDVHRGRRRRPSRCSTSCC